MTFIGGVRLIAGGLLIVMLIESAHGNDSVLPTSDLVVGLQSSRYIVMH